MLQEDEFTAIDTKTMSKKWGIQWRLEGKGFNSGISCVVSKDDSTVYLANNSWDNATMAAIHSATGAEKWTSSVMGGGSLVSFLPNVTIPLFTTLGPVGGCGGLTLLDEETGKQLIR